MPMKLILRTDVENLGRVGDVVSVKPGFGRNYLIPQGKAMLATAGNLRAFELESRKLQANAEAERTSAADLAARIAKAEAVFPVRVGENEKLYGSVTTVMLADALAAEGIEIDRRKILLDAPIRALGEFAVPVKLHPEVTAELTVKVVNRDAGKEEPETEEQTEVEQPEVEQEAVEQPEAE